MAGTTTVAYEDSRTGIQKITFSWTSDASGDADDGSHQIYGKIVRVVTNPTDSPTDNYDIVLNDADGVDVMAGGLANRDTANSEQVISDPPVAVWGTISPVVSNAGNAKSGTIVIYVN